MFPGLISQFVFNRKGRKVFAKRAKPCKLINKLCSVLTFGLVPSRERIFVLFALMNMQIFAHFAVK
ncbi:hypothetical protein BC343_29835 [Mucilaginibacter pedocola]|uniref:Uncharacterized protein n=1 Tax=Mucilaginibacter pedocola TaxID=1792845 RepID=A0A1S9PDI6_9SPHI|nr:hypothetical protein BC343_29835 [Mucilaginibacter pedocola]